MLEHRPRALLRALVAATAMALAAPSLAAAADQLNLIDKTEPVGPGITLRHEKFVDSTGWYDTQVLTVDLANSAVKSDLLTAPKVAQGEALSTMANRVGAAAGVNGDFFDIDSHTSLARRRGQGRRADQERRLQRLGARRRHQGRHRPARRPRRCRRPPTSTAPRSRS